MKKSHVTKGNVFVDIATPEELAGWYCEASRKIEKLEKALRFYADESNWFPVIVNDKITRLTVDSKRATDVARKALGGD